MAADWFYRAKGQQLGPVEPAELRRLADMGIVAPDTPVCKGVAGFWVYARNVQGLFDGSDSPPARAARHVREKPAGGAAGSSADKELASPRTPPPLPAAPPPPLPRVPSPLSDSPRRMRLWLVAWALGAGGAVTAALLAVTLLYRTGKESPPAPQRAAATSVFFGLNDPVVLPAPSLSPKKESEQCGPSSFF